MIFFVFLVITFTLLLRLRSNDNRAFSRTTAGILKALRHGAFGSNAWEFLGEKSWERFMKTELREANKRGRSVVASLELLQAFAHEVEAFNQRQRRLLQALLTRMGVVLFIVVATRWYLGASLDESLDQQLYRADWVAGVGASLLCVVGLWVFARVLESCGWFWQSGMTPAGELWLSELLAASKEMLGAVQAEARERGIKQEQKMTMLEDFIPVTEMLIVGLPSALLLVIPILALLTTKT